MTTSHGAKNTITTAVAMAGHWLNGKLHWAHGWRPTAAYNLPAGVRYIPSFAHANEFSQNVPSAEYVMVFNEPNCGTCGGAQPISVHEAVGLFRQLAGKTNAKLILGNFAVTGSMESWYSDFKSACSGCQWHAVGIHPYDMHTMSHVGRIRKLADGKEIWLTEFNAGTGHDHAGLIRQVVPQLQRIPKSGDICGLLLQHRSPMIMGSLLISATPSI